MIQKISRNPQIQTNMPSFRAKIPAKNPISSIAPNALENSLEALGGK
jgi:hypothetical protein